MEILAQVLQRIKEYYKILQEGDIEFITDRYQAALFRKEGIHFIKIQKEHLMPEL